MHSDTPSTPSQRLKRAREHAGFNSATEAAAALRIPLGTYGGHENGSRAFSVETATKYADAFKVRVAWLLTGEPPMSLTGTPQDNVVRLPLEHWDPAHPDGDAAESEEAVADGLKYSPKVPGGRPEIDVRPGAGHGSVGAEVVAISSRGAVTGHKVVSEWVIPDHFYRHELQASPSSSLIMAVVGDSMAPTLFPGDRIVVDTHQNAFGADGIYVFDDGDSEPRVKRLSKVLFSRPEQVTITSDNPHHPQQTVKLSEIRIIGRVVGRVSRL